MKKLLLTTTIAAGIAFSASATEAGKMYVRGDVGYQFGANKVTDANNKRLNGFTGDVGFGYAISDNIRTDLTVNFSNPSAKNEVKDGKGSGTVTYFNKKTDDALKTATTALNATTGTTVCSNPKEASVSAKGVITDATCPATSGAQTDAQIKLAKDQTDAFKADLKASPTINLAKAYTITVKTKNLGLMANVYYDFTTGSAFTPYVMGGIGINRSKAEFTVAGKQIDNNGGTDAVIKIKSQSKTVFASQVGLGVGVELAKDVVLDVGYKFAYNNGAKFKYKLPEGDLYNGLNEFESSKSKLSSHSLTAGVRFAF